MRDMKSLVYLLIFFSSLFINNASIDQHNHSNVESIALSFVVEELIREKKLLEFSNGFLKEYSIDLNGLLEENTTLYSSGTVCLLSRIDKTEGELELHSEEAKIIKGLILDRKKKENLNQIECELPIKVRKVNLDSFKKMKRNNSFFLTVRHHLEYENIFLVEINAAEIDDIPNISQYSFYIYLNNRSEVVEWNFLEIYDPVSTDGCKG